MTERETKLLAWTKSYNWQKPKRLPRQIKKRMKKFMDCSITYNLQFYTCEP